MKNEAILKDLEKQLDTQFKIRKQKHTDYGSFRHAFKMAIEILRLILCKNDEQSKTSH